MRTHISEPVSPDHLCYSTHLPHPALPHHLVIGNGKEDLDEEADWQLQTSSQIIYLNTF